MLSEIGKNVVIRYHAETAAAQANVRQLQKTQEKHDATLKAQQEGEIKGLEDKIAKYAKYAMYAGAAFAAVKVSIDAMGYAYDQQELRERAAGHSIEALREATRGLVSENELLKLAQSANHGVMKTSADDLIVMAKAMDVYKERGYDATKVAQDFGEYLQTGKARALKDYGLQIDEARGSVAQYAQTMKQLNVVAKDQSKIEEDGADRLQQLKVNLDDATSKIKESFGALVSSAEPLITFLADALRMIVEGWAEIFGVLRSGIDWIDEKLNDASGLTAAREIKKANDVIIESMNQQIDDMRAAQMLALDELDWRITQSWLKLSTPEWQTRMNTIGEFLGNGLGDGMSKGMFKFLNLLGIDNNKGNDKGSKKPRGIRIPVTFTTIDDVEFDVVSARIAAQKAAADKASQRDGVINSGGYLDRVSGSSGFDAPAFAAAMDSQAEISAMAAAADARSESVLRKMFGDPQEIEIYAAGLQTLQAAGQAAFEAFITGSGNAGEAFKAMIAQNMMHLSSEMFGRSIYEAAMAVGSLAMYDFKGAAMHGKAAAMYAGGAVLLGGIAASMGSGAGAKGAGGAAATGSSLPSTTSSAINSAPSDARGRSVTVVVGDDFADDSPRKRQQRAQRMVALGLRTDSEVTYS